MFFQRLATAFLAVLMAGTARAETVAISNVNVVTLDERGVIASTSIVTRDNRIEAVVPAGDKLPPTDRLIDGGGGWLIPGLIDAHVHYASEQQLAGYLRYGVTTVFSLGTGGSLDPLLAARRRVAAGESPGPHIYATGPAIANHRMLATAAEGEAFVGEMAGEGFEFIKVYNSIPLEVFDAVTAAAHARGIGVFGHLPRGFPSEHSLAHGLDVVAHMEEFYFTTFGAPSDAQLASLAPDWSPDLSRVDPILDLVAANHVAIIPNLVAPFTFQQLWEDDQKLLTSPPPDFLDETTREQWARELAGARGRLPPQWAIREQAKYPLLRLMTYRAQQKGILLLAGSDAPVRGVYPGRSLHHELRLLVGAGLTAAEALKTATINGGEATRRFVDHSACIGTIKLGCEADLVLLTADPLLDIRNTDTIAGVMSDGRWYTVPELDALANH